MKQSVKEGLSFGLTSAIITALGLLIGLALATGSKFVAITGLLTIAFADSLSDALGVHMSQEADKTKDEKHIWRATIAAFVAKFFITLTFLIPIILFEINTAIIISIVYGLLIITIFSHKLALSRGDSPKKSIFEHLLIAIIVIVVTFLIGNWINSLGIV